MSPDTDDATTTWKRDDDDDSSLSFSWIPWNCCPWGPGGHGSPSWAWQQVGCEDNAESLQGIFFFLRWLRAYLCVFYNMYTSRSFITSFLPIFLLCMSWGRVASLFSSFFLLLFTSVYQQHLTPQCHPIRICCIQPFWSDLMEGNYLNWSEHYQIYIWWGFRGCF